LQDLAAVDRAAIGGGAGSLGARCLAGRCSMRAATLEQPALAPGGLSRQSCLACLKAAPPLRGEALAFGRIRLWQWAQLDTVHRTGWQATLTAVALGGDHRVHLTRCANDGIHRAGLDAQRAPDAVCLTDDRQRRGSLRVTQGQERSAGEAGEQGDDAFASRWALVDRGGAVGHCLGIRAAGRIVAGTALGLWQYSIDGCHPRIAGRQREGGAAHRPIDRERPVPRPPSSSAFRRGEPG